MKDHTECIRGYHRSSKAHYRDVIDGIEVMFGMYYAQDGSTTGEMAMKWINIVGDKLSPRLECYSDAWSALARFPDLIQKLGDLDDIDLTEEQFCALLDVCGFKDLTKY